MLMSNLSRRIENASNRSLAAKRRTLAAEQNVARTMIDMVRADRSSNPAPQRPMKNVTPKKS